MHVVPPRAREGLPQRAQQGGRRGRHERGRAAGGDDGERAARVNNDTVARTPGPTATLRRVVGRPSATLRGVEFDHPPRCEGSASARVSDPVASAMAAPDADDMKAWLQNNPALRENLQKLITRASSQSSTDPPAEQTMANVNRDADSEFAAADEKNGRTYSCTFCKKDDLFMSEALIVLPNKIWMWDDADADYVEFKEDISMDWQGSLTTICKDCYESEGGKKMRASQFGKLAKKRWPMRRMGAKFHYQLRVREVSWEKAKANIEHRWPGETNTEPTKTNKNTRIRNKQKHKNTKQSEKEYRMRLIAKSKAVAQCIMAAIAKLTEDQKREIEKALQEWESEWEKKGDEYGYIPKLDEYDAEASYLSEILPDVDEFYLCRHRSCQRPIFRNSDWPSNDVNGGGHYLCPLCGEQYRPWQNKAGYYKANKVWVMKDDHHGGGGIAGQHQWRVIPVIWADTTTQNLLTKAKLIMKGLQEELQRVPNKDRIKWMVEKIQESTPASIPQYFKQTQVGNRRRHTRIPPRRCVGGTFPAPRTHTHTGVVRVCLSIRQVSDYALEKLQRKNSQKGDSKFFCAQRMLRDGIYGTTLDHTVDLDEPMQQDDVLRIIGLTNFLRKAPHQVHIEDRQEVYEEV